MDRRCNRAHRTSLLPGTYYTAGAAVGLAVGLQSSAISCTSLPYYAAGAFVGLAEGIHKQAKMLIGREGTDTSEPAIKDTSAVPSGPALPGKPGPPVAPSRPPAHPASTQQQAGAAGTAGNHRPGVYVAMSTPEYMPGGGGPPPAIDEATAEQLVQRYSRSLPSSRRQSAGSVCSLDSSYMSHINTAGEVLPSFHCNHSGAPVSASDRRGAA
jgi:hypothetical protein